MKDIDFDENKDADYDLNYTATEFSFRRMYKELALLNIEGIFLDYNQVGFKKINKFQQFFPMFKDTIFGIAFLHAHYMAHRDIKPMNLM